MSARHDISTKVVSCHHVMLPVTPRRPKGCRVVSGVRHIFFFNHPERTTSNRQVGPSRLSAKGGEFDSPPVTREHGNWMRRLQLLPALRTAVPNDVVPGDAKEK